MDNPLYQFAAYSFLPEFLSESPNRQSDKMDDTSADNRQEEEKRETSAVEEAAIDKPEQPTNGPREGGRRKNKKKKKTLEASCPMKILTDILEKTSFKVPDLSKSVEAKFYHDIDYKLHLGFLLSDIIYRPTVEEISGVETLTVLPSNVKGRVNISPTAITDLKDIYHTFPSRRTKKRLKKENKLTKRKGADKQGTTTTTTTTSNSNNNNSNGTNNGKLTNPSAKIELDVKSQNIVDRKDPPKAQVESGGIAKSVTSSNNETAKTCSNGIQKKSKKKST